MKEWKYGTAAVLVVASTVLIATTGESILIRYVSAVITIALVVVLIASARNQT